MFSFKFKKDKPMNTISVNGRTFSNLSGNNIEIRNGVVKIDGVVQENIDAKGVMEIRVVGTLTNLTTDASVNCNAVTGNVSAGGSVNCDDIGGNVSAGGSVNCDDVGGNVVAGGSVRCN